MNPITLPVAELKPALAGLGKIISKRVTLPVLGCVRIERTREGCIELAGTDLDRTAVFRLDTPDPGEPTTMLIPLEDLANVAKSCGRNDALIIASLGTEEAAIRFPVAGQTVEHKCRTLPFPEFPAIEEVQGEPVVLDAALRQSIHEALQCASTDPTRLVLNGAYLDVSKPGAHYVVGTDGHHLFSANSFALALRESLIVPSHPFLGWKGFDEDGDWRLRVRPCASHRQPIFELASQHWRYLSRSIEGNYPNWRHVVPTSSGAACNIEIPADSLDDVIQIVTRLPDHDERNHTIGIESQGRRLRLLAKSQPDQDWTIVEVP